MASEYNLALKATLDTSQVQQELQRLKNAQIQSNSSGSASSGAVPNTTRLDQTLIKLNQTIVNLQKSIDVLNRKTGSTASQYNSKMPSANAGGVPIAASPETNKLLKKFNDNVAASQAQLMSMMPGRARDAALQALSKIDINGNERALNAQNSLLDKNIARQRRQLAQLIGGQIIVGAGDLATSIGYNKTGAWMSGIGQGITAGGGAGFAASMAGAGAAAGPIGIVVGLAAAAGSVVSALKQLEESAKKTAEQQEKVAEALKESARSQYVQRYGAWQQIRAEQVRKENNLTVAQERESYFKEQLEKARRSYFGLQNPEDFERKTREEAAKKKVEKVNRTIIATPGTVGGGSYSYTTVSDKYNAEEKQKIDEAANKAIEAQQKKVQAAKRELDAAEQNYNLWKDVADYLKNSKDEAAKAERDSKNAEYAKRRQLREGALFASEAYIQSDRIRSTQIMAMDIMNNKQSGPLEKFNKIAEELDRLRSDRKSLVEKAYGINKDIANGRRDSNELADMIKRRDALLKDASFIAERADILENTLRSISTGTIAPDLSHVTSLAQYGFNMGEKDNSVERMEKYYTKSINIQQQIKDKLQEGVKTEAVYN